jgi:hypothetical protein
MLIPTQFLPTDNNLSLSINQIRNNGAMTFSLELKVDTNEYLKGTNLIDALVLDESTNLFSINTLPIWAPYSLVEP